MDTNNISNKIAAVNQALEWGKHIPEAERLDYKRKLIDIRRELKRIQYAVSEPCSTAAFGESQMGKSYLVSAMLSTPSHPFAVTDGEHSYNFISEINPSSPNSTIEATGVITRFTIRCEDNTPKGYLRVQLLSVPDIVLMLCEAYYNQIDYSHETIKQSAEINEILHNIVPEKPLNKGKLLSEDDVLDILDYLNHSTIQKKCNDVLKSDLFGYLIMNLSELSDNQIMAIIELLWNQEEHICKLWKDMLAVYAKLQFASTVYARFDAVLKRKGTLLDVARLDEMYGEPDAAGSEYEPFTEVRLSPEGNAIKIEKSFLSSLIAELRFVLSTELAESRPFLKDLDILDFPGARRPEQLKQSQLDEGKNLSTVLRRGKVAYLFNKYSASKRISTLLFCHNNNMSAESTMGSLLDAWVRNIGDDATSREKYMEKSSVSPLFIIGTWFNKDLEYHDEKNGDKDSLDERWQRRFNVVLEKEVLKSLGDDSHWFNTWSISTKPFQNIYMLRDFKYSKSIYSGYDPSNGTPEKGSPVRPERYPNFFDDLKHSFITNEFVKLHFANPTEAWDCAASCAQDGTSRIITNLNNMAVNIAQAREEKFLSDLNAIIKNLLAILEIRYHPESGDEKLRIAKRQSGMACMQLDRFLGKDAYGFGRLMDNMMISESEIFELLHTQIIGQEQALPMSNEESQMFMGAGLDTNVSREENIERLCGYLGVDDEEECKQVLQAEHVDIDKLLSQSQMMAGRADKLVESVEDLWHDKVLMKRCNDTFAEQMPVIGSMMSSMWSVYKLLDVRKRLVEKVSDYLEQLNSATAIGIISDYLSMQFNAFASSFGFDFMDDVQKQKILKKNKELRLNIDEATLSEADVPTAVEILTDLYKQKELLRSGTFGMKDREFLARFPQYRRLWRWEQQLRIGYIYASELPDYDIKANAELKNILDAINRKG